MLYLIPILAIAALAIAAPIISKKMIARANNMSPEERIAQVNKYFGGYFELQQGELLVAAVGAQLYDGPLIPEQHYSKSDAAVDMAKNVGLAFVGVKRTVRAAQVYLGITNYQRFVVAVEGDDDYKTCDFPMGSQLLSADQAFPGQHPGKAPSGSMQMFVAVAPSGHRIGVWSEPTTLDYLRQLPPLGQGAPAGQAVAPQHAQPAPQLAQHAMQSQQPAYAQAAGHQAAPHYAQQAAPSHYRA